MRRVADGTGFGRKVVAFVALLMLCGARCGVCAQPATAAKNQQTIAEKIAASRDLLDINTATAAELKALPGMGEEYARRVIANRPYSAKNQLTTRGVIPAEEYERIRPLIVAHRVKTK